MAAVKFEANFLSSVAHIIDYSSVSGTPATDFTARIEDLLGRAQTAYARCAYSDAVTLYKQARSEVFRLLDPSHATPRHVLDDSFVLPVSADLEVKIAEAGLKLAEVVKPSISLQLPPVGVANAPIPDVVKRFDRVGFALDTSIPTPVRVQAALGVDLLNKGFADQAATVLSAALSGIAQPSTNEAKQFAASVALNLSGAQVLAGRANDGAAAATQAQTLFSSLNDAAGQAQAQHNQAVALMQAGKPQDAQIALATASTLATMHPSPVVASPSTPGVSTTPAVSTTVASATPVVATHPVVATNPVLSASPTVAVNPGRVSSVATLNPAAATRAVGPNALLTTAVLTSAPTTIAIQTTADTSFVGKDLSTLAIQIPPTAGVVTAVDTATLALPPRPVTSTWAWSVPAGAAIADIAWTGGVRPAPQVLLDAVYKPRVIATKLDDLRLFFTGAGETNAYLTHIYGFVIPQALGDCYSQLGQFAIAESYYLQTAAYSWINTALEVPALWIRLAENTVRWGDSLYRSERMDEAKTVYAKLVTNAGAAGASPLYSLPVFAAPAADAKTLIANLANPQNAAINPSIARPILVAWARWQYLLAGLDFFGTTFTPILTFEYLQQAARELAQQAVQAEREYVDFQSRSEAAAATRRELQSAAAMANAAIAVQQAQYQSAIADTNAAKAAQNLADLRATNAAKDRAAYATDGYWQYVSSSIAAAHGAHADWHGDEIRQLAANMEAGSWKGDPGKLAAAATLLGGQKSYEYQLGRLDEAVGEMNATKPIAQAQAAAAAFRQESARLQLEAAQTHAALANDALSAFDNNVFTPEVWSRMANVMRGLSEDYLDWAVRIAKLMERAYNFENDDAAKIIRSEYPGVQGADNLFGADFLMRDIESFTYRFIANQRAKQSQIKDVISLANQYPFDFYRFQQTGRMTFETSLHDADLRHPGFYEQRLAGVELEVIGLMPPEGIHGALRAGGISRYRTVDGGERTRLHTVDTLALSEFTARNDGLVFRIDPRIHGLFEGHGIATTWDLDLPHRSNNLDYRLITDVRLVLYYGAYYDATLHDTILAAAPKPGEMIHVRSLLLRFDFPDVWYTLLDTGEATFSVGPDYFPRNETNFRTQQLALALIGADGVSPANVAITVTPPGKSAATLSTDAGGQLAAAPGNALAAQLGGPVLGDWTLSIKPAAGSPLLESDGSLAGDKLDQLSLLIQYEFDWPA
jgi:hypothetical protein